MLPVVEPEGRVTSQQIVVYTVMLLPVSLLPYALGVSGKIICWRSHPGAAFSI
jgi:heme O synthase-like polyprenyltransferase